jgi:hypothetical protein
MPADRKRAGLPVTGCSWSAAPAATQPSKESDEYLEPMSPNEQSDLRSVVPSWADCSRSSHQVLGPDCSGGHMFSVHNCKNFSVCGYRLFRAVCEA